MSLAAYFNISIFGSVTVKGYMTGAILKESIFGEESFDLFSIIDAELKTYQDMTALPDNVSYANMIQPVVYADIPPDANISKLTGLSNKYRIGEIGYFVGDVNTHSEYLQFPQQKTKGTLIFAGNNENSEFLPTEPTTISHLRGIGAVTNSLLQVQNWIGNYEIFCNRIDVAAYSTIQLDLVINYYSILMYAPEYDTSSEASDYAFFPF